MRRSSTIWMVGVALLSLLALSACGASKTAAPAKAKPSVPAASAGKPVATTPSTSAAATDTSWEARYKGVLVYGFRTTQKVVAITLDDGPNSFAKTVADTLDAYGAKGTFFCSKASVKKYPDAIRLLQSRGGEIESHTADHKPLTGTAAFDRDQIDRLDALITPVIGHGTTWVRPMGGGVNKLGLQVAAQTGHLVINWDVDSLDSHAQYTPPATLVHTVITNVRPGSVILMHFSHRESIQALPKICAWLKANGYRMVTVSELARLATGPR